MKTFILAIVSISFFGCAQLHAPQAVNAIAQTSAGATVIAKAANSVINSGLDAAATAIPTGNPYVHSVADALRANANNIVTPADVQLIAKNYGDPANQHKFKQLALDIWNVIKSASARMAMNTATQLVANGLNQGATK